MNRRYSTNRAKPKPKSVKLVSQLTLVLSSAVFGYVLALFCSPQDMHVWFTQRLLPEQPSTPTPQVTVAHESLPKPKLEFYTLLTNQSGAPVTQAVPATNTVNPPTSAVSTTAPTSTPTVTATTETTTVATNKPVTPTVSIELTARPTHRLPPILSKESYLVQVASFRSRSEAERMKAGLVLKGFDVSIVSVNQNQMDWFRVMIGPFSSKVLAQRAQSDFAKREHVVGMIRKLDA